MQNNTATTDLTPDQYQYVTSSVQSNLKTCYTQSYTLKDGKLQVFKKK